MTKLYAEPSLKDIDSATAFSSSLAPDISATLPITPNKNIGLIVVPAVRSCAHLDHAIELAHASNTALVIITSHGLNPAAAQQAIQRMGVNGYVISVADNFVVPFMAHFATNTHKRTVTRSSNLSAKRNLGLLLGHLTNTNLFFLDDDIRNLTSAKLYQAGHALNKYTVAGFLSYDFPDNSVVRHAYRLSGGEQSVFIAGNSLAVNIARTSSFFPNVYNEDWLFFHKAVEHRKAANVGKVNQIRYDPFVPSRAASEEFGCVLATEGLYTLLTEPRSNPDIGEPYWSDALHRRKLFVTDVTTRLKNSYRTDEQAKRALKCLAAAQTELERLTPSDFTSYVEAWQRDLTAWKDRIAKLPIGLTLMQAMEYVYTMV